MKRRVSDFYVEEDGVLRLRPLNHLGRPTATDKEFAEAWSKLQGMLDKYWADRGGWPGRGLEVDVTKSDHLPTIGERRK